LTGYKKNYTVLLCPRRTVQTSQGTNVRTALPKTKLVNFCKNPEFDSGNKNVSTPTLSPCLVYARVFDFPDFLKTGKIGKI